MTCNLEHQFQWFAPIKSIGILLRTPNGVLVAVKRWHEIFHAGFLIDFNPSKVLILRNAKIRIDFGSGRRVKMAIKVSFDETLYTEIILKI